MFNTTNSGTNNTSSGAHNFEMNGSMAPTNGSVAYSPTSILHHHSLPPFPTSITRTWGGVGGFTTPLQPAPPLCAPPLTVASSLGNPQMPTNSMYNSSSPMGYHFRVSSTNIVPACKRKPDDDLDDKCPSAKQHITEEKVSAGLNSLHLSPHFTSHTLGNSKNTDGSVLIKDCTEDTDSDSSSGTSSDASPRLYLNTDINKVSIENRSSLPETLLKNLKRDGPCLEVVLWQPRSHILSNVVSSFEGGGRCQQPADDDLVCESGSSSATSTSPSATVTTTSAANGFARFYNSAGAGGSAISSPDSGVSVSPPSNSTASFETTCEMDEDAFSSASAGLARVNSGSGAGGLSSAVASFSSNPFSLFYPSPSAAASSNPAVAGGTGSAGTMSASGNVPPPSDLADLLLQNNNNNNGTAASAYTRSWVEENNNTGLRDLNSRPNDSLPLRVDLLPPLPDDDDMDL